MLVLGLISLTGYIERLFLADFSKEAWAGALNGFFLARIFQAACLAVVVVGQAFVGLYHGSNQPKQIGPCVWQLIWFSILSMFLVVPCGFLFQHLLFADTVLASTESQYFSILCFSNFLFVLGGALSAFYLGRGKTKVVVVLTIGCSLLNIGLDYLLIFGWRFIPTLGAAGAAWGRVLAQVVLCGILLTLFLKRSNQEAYATHQWKLSTNRFWHYIRPGSLRAFAAFFALGDWVLVSRLMSLNSETHASVFDMGSTIFYFLTFIGDGIYQTTVTMASNQMGKKDYSQVWASFYSGIAFVLIFGVILAIPFFFFKEVFIIGFKDSSFYPQSASIFNLMSPWLWLSVVAYGFNTVMTGFLVAARDTKFILAFFTVLWVFSLLPVYLTMNVLNVSPGLFWMIVMGTNLVVSLSFLWRASQEKWKQDNWQLRLPLPESLPSV